MNVILNSINKVNFFYPSRKLSKNSNIENLMIIFLPFNNKILVQSSTTPYKHTQ